MIWSTESETDNYLSTPQGSGIYAGEEEKRLQKLEVMDDSKEIVPTRHNRTDISFLFPRKQCHLGTTG